MYELELKIFNIYSEIKSVNAFSIKNDFHEESVTKDVHLHKLWLNLHKTDCLQYVCDVPSIMSYIFKYLNIA